MPELHGGFLPSPGLDSLYILFGLDLHPGKYPDDLVLDVAKQLREHFERLALVLLHGLLLCIATQPDALAQVVHVAQVIFPLLIEYVEHQGFLEMPHDIRAGQLFLGQEVFVHGVHNSAPQHFLVDVLIL